MKAMNRTLTTLAMTGLALAASCSHQPGIDEVPVGSRVQVTRDDGALVEGRLTDRSEDTVLLDVGPTTRTVARKAIADFRMRRATPQETLPAAARFREVTVPETTRLAIRLDTPVSSASAPHDTRIRGAIVDPVVIGGVTAIPIGAVVSGTVTGAHQAAMVTGRTILELEFDSLIVDGESHPLHARFARTAAWTANHDAERIAMPALGGAATVVVLTSAGPEISVAEGTVLSVVAGRLLVMRVPLR